MENPATGLASAERITARRRSIHTHPYAQPHPPKQQQVDAINELTTNVDERRIPTSKEPTNRHASRVACDRHTTPPACTPTRHSQSPGVCSRPGVEASGNGVDVQEERHDMSDQPRFCTPHRSVRPPAGKTDRTSTKQRACGHASHLFRAEASRGFTNSSRDQNLAR